MRVKNYLLYKLLNSLFLGLSTGAVFIIYEPLKPSIYSLGGILLSVGTLLIASQYARLMNARAFFWVLLIVELVTALLVVIFLALGKSLLSALLIYLCYQITFLFGSYIVRAETVILRRTKLFSYADILKQIGYLSGLGAAFVCYEIYEYLDIFQKEAQVYYLHYILIVVQFIVISVLLTSFKKQKGRISKNDECHIRT